MSETPVVDFDHHSREYLDDRLGQWSRLRRCPVARSPHHGGFWVVSGYSAVAQVSRDEETFSSLYRPEPAEGPALMGIAGCPRPRGIPSAGIAEVDGPLHLALRRVINPYMVPGAVSALEPFMRELTTWFIDQRIESGAIDLVADLASPVPAVVTMKTLGLPLGDWDHYAEFFHATVAYGRSDPQWRQAMARLPDMMSQLLEEARARRQAPADDLLTRLVEMRLPDGRELSDDEIVAVLWNLVGGGLDTTASLTSLALHHLDARPELRQELIERPELLEPATEEFLRYFSVNETLTRTVTTPTELEGVRLAPGDIVLLSWLSANHDESEFDRPDQVVLDRPANRHLAFGVGPHRCIGMHVARSMFRIVLEAVLDRLPDYRVDRAATRFYAGNPTLNGVVTMPARFTPGPRLGPPEPPF